MLRRRETSKIERAQHFRRNMTPAEAGLWELLRANRIGFHFRRQEVLGPFIADFYCRRTRVAVEVDGGVHREQLEADAERDAFLKENGILVLRFTNEQVQFGQQAVLNKIRAACEARERGWRQIIESDDSQR